MSKTEKKNKKKRKEEKDTLEEKKGTRKYFEAFIPEDEHMSDKTDDDGCQAAILFPSEGKGTTGPLRVKEIDISDERQKINLQIAQFLSNYEEGEVKLRQQRHDNFIETVKTLGKLGKEIERVAPYVIKFGFWCHDTAVPTVKNRTIPWVRKKVSNVFHGKIHTETAKVEETIEGTINSEAPKTSMLEQYTPESFIALAGKAHYQYKLNVSNEEAQRHFLNMVFAAAILAKEIKFFSEHTVAPDTVKLDQEQYRAWQIALEEFATEKVAESINNILISESPLLKEPDIIPFYQAIGGKISEEKVFIPIHQQDLQNALGIAED